MVINPQLVIYLYCDLKYFLGVTSVKTPFGNKVKTYDKERCICELFLYDYDTKEIKFALNELIKDSYDILKLYTYAKLLKYMKGLNKFLNYYDRFK